ncbi:MULTISPECIES: hypothetical protein [unclassified Saccharopolyspora]|uniref:hypothetical protein n=1 Tax=unclassified Saccharopolyspora TaxID=2646250 RepID=UPI001CD59660|nr:MULTISPECIES: hypothetical protein [unclassified Saccharopolyspora]MCA1189779.1 hypothetical protein [Saccharopolyspora sp. 6T]MCA1191347.1 hypothetical protein [Saccharopolyspora sp. 6V]MCA1225052.1 hypothetical protein [Saccharopolyspora sp. 6M]MCA1282393.1 hypothetical protein [Saccharopolyspora sp. 7B]
MRVRPVAGALIAGLCLAGCGDPAPPAAQEPPAVVTLPKAISPPPAGAPTSATPPAPSVSSTTTASSTPRATSTPDEEPTSGAEESSTAPDGGDVECGTFTDKAGRGHRLFAGRSDAGEVLSCGEADRVMNKYFSLPKDQVEGSGRFANFEDYGCASTPKDRVQALCSSSDGKSSYITA